MSEKQEIKQIKSKKRVAEHGEVFTAPREVNAMLDLVKQETNRIESTFLEPACGDGNFLVVYCVKQQKTAILRGIRLLAVHSSRMYNTYVTTGRWSPLWLLA